MSAPLAIKTDATQRMLTIHWTNERAQHIAHAQLRRACRCAQCHRLRLDGVTIDTTPDVTLIDLRPMGYGVQLVFSDGHERGIYPWGYLDEIAAQLSDAPA